MEEQTPPPNYWLFQINPQVFQLREALRAGQLQTFAVKQHRKKIKKGDRVILWATGKEAGCYGLAVVNSEVQQMLPSEFEQTYFLEEVGADWRVELIVDYNLWNKPITAELLKGEAAFNKFYAGLPGTNYKATEVQYERLVKAINEHDLALEPEIEYGVPASLPEFLNLILYGPPGTGKTFLTVNYALSIIENRSLAELALEPRSELRRRFEEYLNAGQIAFVTFHQSFSYEDFVEGIKPVSKNGQLTYQVEEGLFKLICHDARRCFYEALLKAQPIEKQTVEFHQLYSSFLKYLQSEEFQYFQTPAQRNVFLQRVLRFGDLSVRTAKSFAVQTVLKSRLQKLFRFVSEGGTTEMTEGAVRQLIGEGNPHVYWAVFSALKNYEENFLAKKEKEELAELEPEILSQFELPPATDEILANCRRYVLIIDEINRGNIASIFGELITLLESDKREGRPEALSTILPYSKSNFSIPPNLHLIGTMNSTDRSVAQMDMALRRRFAFLPLEPDAQLLGKGRPPMAAGIDLVRLLETINQRLSLLLGSDYRIGHAYFLEVFTLDDIKRVFEQQLLPLLQEYFFDDLPKIGLVLGRDFVEQLPAETDILADFDEASLDEYAKRQLYRLRPMAELNESAFIHIYDPNYHHEQ